MQRSHELELQPYSIFSYATRTSIQDRHAGRQTKAILSCFSTPFSYFLKKDPMKSGCVSLHRRRTVQHAPDWRQIALMEKAVTAEGRRELQTERER